MPNKKDHIEKAVFNEEFGNFLIENHNKYSTWAVVSFHYSAIHWVEAYLATKGIHSTTHIDRENYFYRESNLRIIYDEFSQLDSDSRSARYQNSKFEDSDISEIITLLDGIKKHISTIL